MGFACRTWVQAPPLAHPFNAMMKPEEPYDITKYVKWDPVKGKAPEFEEFLEGNGPPYPTSPQDMVKEAYLNTEFFQAGLKALNDKLDADAKEQTERN